MKYKAEIEFNSLADIDVSKIRFTNCLRCHRKLKTQESQKLGFGKICWQKHLTEHQTTLF